MFLEKNKRKKERLYLKFLEWDEGSKTTDNNQNCDFPFGVWCHHARSNVLMACHIVNDSPQIGQTIKKVLTSWVCSKFNI